jgi:hypothetical protein
MNPKMFITIKDYLTGMSSSGVKQSKGRPGLKAGRSNEFTLMMPLKPGGAARLRTKMADTFRE